MEKQEIGMVVKLIILDFLYYVTKYVYHINTAALLLMFWLFP